MKVHRRMICASAMSVGAVLAAYGVVAVAQAAPAAAECVYADAWVSWSGGGTTEVTPWPQGYCLVATPWTYAAEPYANDQEQNVPTGVPNGGGVQAGVTSPE